MTPDTKVSLDLLPTGVPGLDEVLGGGLPEYSLTLVAGPPGAGKTTMTHQIAFANASVDRPAMYFSVVGEPPLKMLRYQQQMKFFDPVKVGSALRFVDLSPQSATGDLGLVLDKIVSTVRQAKPGIVVVDSFRSILRRKLTGKGSVELPDFVQQLALFLTSWEVTSFLIGEYGERELEKNALFTVTDGILRLTQSRERNSMIRKLEVVKMRGLPALPGLHTFRISTNGIHVFPRTTTRGERPLGLKASRARTGFGVPALDAMLGGGPPAGDATLVAGPSGTGKSLLATQFVDDANAAGEAAVLAVFEEHPDDYVERAKDMGVDLAGIVERGKLEVLNLRPLDLSADEILDRIQTAVARLDAKRLVIDSLNGLELSLAPTFRDDFRDSLYRMVNRLSGSGVSILFTMEVMESFTDIKFSPHAISFLAQNIISLRFVEIDGQLRRMLAVVKMRRSQHSHDLREYEITGDGFRLLSTLSRYHGLLTGVPTPQMIPVELSHLPGLTAEEANLLARLRETTELTEPQLAAFNLVSGEALPRALERLVHLNYVIKGMRGGTGYYRTVERPLGQ